MIKYFKKRLKKGAIEFDTLAGFIIAIAVIILVTIIFFVLKDKGIGALEYIKNLFRFGGVN